MTTPSSRSRKSNSSDDHEDDSTSLKCLMRSVVKIYCHHATPNFAMPWQIKRQETSTSSGFVVSGKRIICNAHGVAFGTNVQVRKHGNSKKYFARIAHIGHECDLAILTVEDSTFWDGVDPLEFGGVPELQDKVFVVGYPTGGDDICVTEGVVSRVGVAEYAHSGEALLTIQIDAAINSGNSGGPAFCGSTIAGVAFESLDFADNIGYIIPVPVIRHFLHDVDQGGYKGFPLLNIFNQTTENKTLRKFNKIPALTKVIRLLYPDAKTPIKIPAVPVTGDGATVTATIDGVEYSLSRSLIHTGQTYLPGPLKHYLSDPESDDGSIGMRVSRVVPLTQVSKELKNGDVILAFDHTPVASNSTVIFRGRERVAFSHILTSKFIGDRGEILVLRGGQILSLNPVLQRRRELVKWRHFTQAPSYFVFMGMVFLVLSAPYLESEFGSKWERQAPIHLVERLFSGIMKQKTEDEQIVVLSHVLVSEHNMGYEEDEHQVVAKVNDVEVNNLTHLSTLICNILSKADTCALTCVPDEDRYLRIELTNGATIILDITDSQTKHIDILTQHQIPLPGASVDIRAAYADSNLDSNSNVVTPTTATVEVIEEDTPKPKTQQKHKQTDKLEADGKKRKRV